MSCVVFLNLFWKESICQLMVSYFDAQSFRILPWPVMLEITGNYKVQQILFPCLVNSHTRAYGCKVTSVQIINCVVFNVQHDQNCNAWIRKTEWACLVTDEMQVFNSTAEFSFNWNVAEFYYESKFCFKFTIFRNNLHVACRFRLRKVVIVDKGRNVKYPVSNMYHMEILLAKHSNRQAS